jgi:SprT protein
VQLEIPFEAGGRAGGEHLRARVREYTGELLSLARSRWPDAGFPPVRVDFRLRGRSAGEACVQTATTNYNGEMLDRHGESFIRRIVPHEVAHIVAHHAFAGPIRPHGREWKSVMSFFGASDSVTHDFESKPARTYGRFAYGCRCASPHYLTKRAHGRVRRRTVEYTCLECGEALSFLGTIR